MQMYNILCKIKKKNRSWNL